MGRRLRRLEPAPAAGGGRRGGLARPRAARGGEPAVRHDAARERGRRRSAYEAPHGSVAPGPVSSGAESKRRRCPRSRARQSRVTLLALASAGARAYNPHMSTADRMNFGIFMAPFHRIGDNPTYALRRDLELIEFLDHLSYDEAWFGEHHSAGYEIIPSPEVFIAAAAERTRHIRLGTGVCSLPYHHPLILADRMIRLA